MNRAIRGVTLALSLLAGLALPPSTAQAQPDPAPSNYWCPGQPIPRGVVWNMANCHQYHYVTTRDGTVVAIPGP